MLQHTEFTSGSIKAAIAGGLGIFLGPLPMISSVLGVFILPISAEFALDRTHVSSIMAIAPVVMVLATPLAGWAIDRWGPRRVLIAGLVAFALMQFALSTVTSVPELAAGYLLLSAAGSLQAATGFTKLIALWFARRRGAVMGLMIALGGGAGAALMPQITRLVVEQAGWREGYVVLGILMLVLGLPIFLLYLREPDNIAAARSHDPTSGADLRDAMRTTTFWLMLAIIFLCSTVEMGIVTHISPMLIERHFTSQEAASAISSVFAGGIAGQLSSGFAADRFNSPRIAILYLIAALCGIATIYAAMSPMLVLAGSAMLGFGQGAGIALMAYLTSRYFGLQHYSAIFSVMIATSNLGIAVGTVAMGIIYDSYGSYDPGLLLGCAGMVAALLCVAALKPYRFDSNVPVAGRT